MNRIFILVSFFYIVALPQAELHKWQQNEISYRIQNLDSKRDYSYNDKSISGIFLKSTIILYWTVISDVDGDNCPFHPSCSAFLTDAVKKTNLFTGTLLFFDRFARDATPINKHKHYPILHNKFLDPVDKYIFLAP